MTDLDARTTREAGSRDTQPGMAAHTARHGGHQGRVPNTVKPGLASLLAAGLTLVLAGSALADWTGPEVITDARIPGVADRNVALDGNGKAHTVYQPGTWHEDGRHWEWHIRVEYATNRGGTWRTTTLLPFQNGASYDTESIAVDTAGKVHVLVARRTSSGHKMVYVTNRSGSWVSSRLAAAIWSSAHLQVLNGKLHIAYSTGSGVFYRTNASGRWVNTKIGTTGWVRDFALDSRGKAHVAWERSEPSRLYYTTNRSGNWVRRTISEHPYDLGLRFAVDGDLKVHLAWTRASSAIHIRYATNRSGTWSASARVAAGANVGLTVSGRGKVHIVSGDMVSRYQHTTNRSGSWVTVPLSGDGHGNTPAVAVDALGNAHAVLDAAGDGLIYTRET
ncbi:hypothetical protein BH23CHL8_BH23CHL8_29100 [soil metagenome]